MHHAFSGLPWIPPPAPINTRTNGQASFYSRVKKKTEKSRGPPSGANQADRCQVNPPAGRASVPPAPREAVCVKDEERAHYSCSRIKTPFRSITYAAKPLMFEMTGEQRSDGDAGRVWRCTRGCPCGWRLKRSGCLLLAPRRLSVFLTY